MTAPTITLAADIETTETREPVRVEATDMALDLHAAGSVRDFIPLWDPESCC